MSITMNAIAMEDKTMTPKEQAELEKALSDFAKAVAEWQKVKEMLDKCGAEFYRAKSRLEKLQKQKSQMEAIK